LNLNAIFHRKMSDYNPKPYRVRKVIELSSDEFQSLLQNPMKHRSYISDNIEFMNCDENGVYNCMLALGEGSDDGLLIDAEGYDYARLSAFLPNARQLMELNQFQEELQSEEIETDENQSMQM